MCHCMTSIYCYSDEKTKPWSKWNESDYDEFQQDLRKEIKNKYPESTSLEWEGPAWIEIAKLEKNV